MLTTYNFFLFLLICLLVLGVCIINTTPAPAFLNGEIPNSCEMWPREQSGCQEGEAGPPGNQSWGTSGAHELCGGGVGGNPGCWLSAQLSLCMGGGRTFPLRGQ